MATSPITPTNSSQNTATSASSSNATGLGGVTPSEGTFLTLLVTQLKNQDPLNPTDSTQFVSELAQFSSLEQLININQGVTNITSVVDPNASTTSSSNSGATSNSATTDGSNIDNTLNNSLLNNLG